MTRANWNCPCPEAIIHHNKVRRGIYMQEVLTKTTCPKPWRYMLCLYMINEQLTCIPKLSLLTLWKKVKKFPSVADKCRIHNEITYGRG